MAFQPPMRPKAKPAAPKEWFDEFMEKDEVLLYITAALGVFLPGLVYLIYHKVHNMYTAYALKRDAKKWAEEAARCEVAVIVLGKLEGAAEAYRNRLKSVFEQELAIPPKMWSAATLKASELAAFKGMCVFLVDTVSGLPSECSLWLLEWMEDVAADQKQKKKTHFHDIRFAVAAFGTSTEGEQAYNKASKTLSKRLKILGSKQMLPVEPFDLAVDEKTNEAQFTVWSEELLDALDRNLPGRESASEEESTDDESDDENYRQKKTM